MPIKGGLIVIIVGLFGLALALRFLLTATLVAIKCYTVLEVLQEYPKTSKLILMMISLVSFGISYSLDKEINMIFITGLFITNILLYLYKYTLIH